MFTTKGLRSRTPPDRQITTERGIFLHPYEAGKVLGLKGSSHIKDRVIRHVTLWLGRAPGLHPKRYPLRKLLIYISEADCAAALTEKANAAARQSDDRMFLAQAAARAKTDKQGFREAAREREIDLTKELRLDRRGRACRRVIVPSAALSQIKPPIALRGSHTLIELAEKWGYDKGYIRSHAKALAIPMPLFKAKDSMGRWSPLSHVLAEDQPRLKAALGHLPKENQSGRDVEHDILHRCGRRCDPDATPAIAAPTPQQPAVETDSTMHRRRGPAPSRETAAVYKACYEGMEARKSLKIVLKEVQERFSAEDFSPPRCVQHVSIYAGRYAKIASKPWPIPR